MSGDEGKQNKRMDRLRERFRKKFNRESEFIVRAPGRVNLIGEHIDYCGYGVFPMAIEQDILVAATKEDCGKENTIELKNTDDSRYADFSCSLAGDLKIDSCRPRWSDYFLCGVKAIRERFPDRPLPGLRLLVDGRVPPAAGLSSSSALVCAAALTTMHSIGEDVPRDELASLCARCERYVGVQGGGMDQAICLLAEKGSAKLIEFEPVLSARTVALPEEAVFIVANSCVEINKGNTSYYNSRVVECRLAGQLLLKKCGQAWKEAVRLCDVQKRLHLSLADCASLVRKALHEEPYSLDELLISFEIPSKNEFVSWALSDKTKDLVNFELHKRALHVFEEAQRVHKFKEACEKGDIEEMGRLMDRSHSSCRDLYECSHPQLDRIVDLCRKNGALGSRLTGAGWGGCAVTLARASEAASITDVLTKYFYEPLGLKSEDNVFVSSPADCGRILTEFIAREHAT